MNFHGRPLETGAGNGFAAVLKIPKAAPFTIPDAINFFQIGKN